METKLLIISVTINIAAIIIFCYDMFFNKRGNIPSFMTRKSSYKSIYSNKIEKFATDTKKRLNSLFEDGLPVESYYKLVISIIEDSIINIDKADNVEDCTKRLITLKILIDNISDLTDRDIISPRKSNDLINATAKAAETINTRARTILDNSCESFK